jgi:hypothetical protein
LTLPHRKEPVHADRLPPGVRGEAAVVVLGADRDLQHLGRKVDAVPGVVLHGRGVHRREAIQGRSAGRAGALQVFPGFGGQGGEVPPGGILPEIQVDPPAPDQAFPVDQEVDQEEPPVDRLPRIEGPQVALEEYRRIPGVRGGERRELGILLLVPRRGPPTRSGAPCLVGARDVQRKPIEARP